MRYEIRLLGPTGMVSEVHPGIGDEPCAVTLARILLEQHREMASAELRLDGDVLEIACEYGH